MQRVGVGAERDRGGHGVHRCRVSGGGGGGGGSGSGSGSMFTRAGASLHSLNIADLDAITLIK